MYLAKLHEKILKYFSSDSFKKHTIGFDSDFQRVLESPATLSNGLLV